MLETCNDWRLTIGDGKASAEINNQQSTIDNRQSTIHFEVEDTGIGIPPEQIETIFSPFEQIKDKRLYSEGTGLRLAISQRLVRMMDSELHVKSTPGQGSTFWFDLELPEIEGRIMSVTEPSRRIVGFRVLQLPRLRSEQVRSGQG